MEQVGRSVALHNVGDRNLRSYNGHHHHHKHQGLDPLIRSVPRVTVALSNVSSVFLLSFFLVVCSGMISRVPIMVCIRINIYLTVAINCRCFLQHGALGDGV